MAFFRDMSDRMWQYISPRKTQHRREKPFKVPIMPVHASSTVAAKRDSTPRSVVNRWRAGAPRDSSQDDGALLPPSPPTSISRHDDLEGDTLVQDFEQQAQISYAADDWDANDDTVVVDDGKYMEESKAINREKEVARQENQGRELREAGWTEDAVFLFQKLGMRGFEPLLPERWINDFESLPLDLFTSNDSKAFVRSDGGYDFHAQRALAELFTLGGLARDAVVTRAPVRTPEYHIKRSVRQYYQWAVKDGLVDSVSEDLALFDIIAIGKNTNPRVGEERMIKRLSRLHGRWKLALDTHQSGKGHSSNLSASPVEVPALYGIVASFTVMAFVGYVPPSGPEGEASLRLIATFDFGEEGYDVWNALAIAIFAVHCRNRMKQVIEFLPTSNKAADCDPDL